MLTGGVRSENKLETVGGGFLFKWNDCTDIGAGLKFQRGAKKAPADVKEGESDREASSYSMVVGAAFRCDGATTKVKVDTNGDVHGSYTAPVRGGAILTVVGRVNVTKSDNAAFGLQVALK